MKFKNLLITDIMKLKSTPVLWLHLLVPVLGLMVFLSYYSVSPMDVFMKQKTYITVMCMAFPILIGMITAMVAEAEDQAGNYRNLLNVFPIKWLALMSKYLVLIVFGALSTVIAVIGFYLGMSQMVTALPIGTYFALTGILFGCSLFLYAFYLFLSLRFSKSVSVGIGIFEALIVALFRTGMGDALKASLLQQWQIEKGKQEQISAFAHDIKTPLTIIKGNVELLGETVLDPEQMLYQKYIIENATQIEGYINKLVELSKSETPEALAVKKIAVKDLLDSIHEQTRGMIVKKNIKITWQEMDLASVTIQADREKLYRAIMNVMGNAVEFTPSQGTIAVTAQKRDSKLILIILDSGKGFGDQALRHGKEQFFMSDRSRTDHKHHGMGLYIADNIVKQHGGQLVIGNTAQGGLVTITLQVLN